MPNSNSRVGEGSGRPMEIYRGGNKKDFAPEGRELRNSLNITGEVFLLDCKGKGEKKSWNPVKLPTNSYSGEEEGKGGKKGIEKNLREPERWASMASGRREVSL